MQLVSRPHASPKSRLLLFSILSPALFQGHGPCTRNSSRTPSPSLSLFLYLFASSKLLPERSSQRTNLIAHSPASFFKKSLFP